jgi:hypothetical protein
VHIADHAITDEDLQAFARKLETFATELSPAQQKLLISLLITEQALEDSDVQGYSYYYYHRVYYRDLLDMLQRVTVLN